MNRAYYSDPIATFLQRSPDEVLGVLAGSTSFALEVSQRDAWKQQIEILHRVLPAYRDDGHVYFEYSVPRLGKRIDVILLIRHVLFVIEFQAGESEFASREHRRAVDESPTAPAATSS